MPAEHTQAHAQRSALGILHPLTRLLPELLAGCSLLAAVPRLLPLLLATL
jgi:hypothetical protein